MAAARFSQSTLVGIACNIFGVVSIGFGLNVLLNRNAAVEFFEVKAPLAASPDRLVFDVIMAVYGIRNVFMGLTVHAAALGGSRKTQGLLLLLTSGIAFADGYICKVYVGNGQWNHWGWGPMVALAGLAAVGAFDRA